MEIAEFWYNEPNEAKYHAAGDIFVIRNFRIGWGTVAAFVLLGAFTGSAQASVHRGDFPGRDHNGRFVMVPASHPAPATGAREEDSNEVALPDPASGFPDAVPGSAGSGCETSHPGSGPFCVHPGLLKSRGQ
jgi:hypothetical protein